MAPSKNQSYSMQLADITSALFTNCTEKENRHVAKYDISIAGFRCIKILYEIKEITVNQLAQKMSLTSSRITRIIDGLVAKNLVHRISGTNDRRIYNLSLTDKGNKLAENLIITY